MAKKVPIPYTPTTTTEDILLQPGYGPVEGDLSTATSHFFSEALQTVGSLYIEIPKGWKFGCLAGGKFKEYIYLDADIDEARNTISNITIIPTFRKLKTEAPLNKAASNVDLNSEKVYPVIVDSNDNLAVVVPWTLPEVATASTAGTIKVKAVVNLSVGVSLDANVSNRYYGVLVDKDGKAFVNVPWVSSEGSVPGDFIEVVEPGIYNIDKNFTTEPIGNTIVNTTTETSGDLASITNDVNRIKAVLGSLLSTSGAGNDSKFVISSM